MSDLSISLRSLLGAESAGEWIYFMDKIGAELPFLLSRGRPTATAIADSEIGASGHKSWSSYIEHELHWNVNTWRAWQRAYTLVAKYPYLRDLELSASAINSLNAKSNKFPADLESYNSAKAEIKTNADATKAESLSALKQRVLSLEENNSELSSELIALKASSAKEISILLSNLSELKNSSSRARAKLSSDLKGKSGELSEIRRRVSRFKARSFISRIFADL